MSSANDLLKDAAKREPGNEVKIRIRDLLAHWNAKRRGFWVVATIESDLKKAGLKTDPPFTEGWIDNVVMLVPVRKEGKQKTSSTTSPDAVDATDRSLPEVSLTVGSLPSANLGVVSVSPQDSLERAQSLMMRHDYSQLAVMSGSRDLRGAVSWESIAQARIRNPQAGLQDAVITGEIIHNDDDLLAQIPRIVDAGFVFVQGPDRQITGIVTTADLSDQFAILAKPFFVLAEIERRLRRIVDGAFQSEELQAVVDPADATRQVKSAEDLTLGEYVRLLEDPERWRRLGWALDRKIFIEGLQQVRAIRNDVMHFSPDPLDSDQIVALENFVKWLRRLSL
jgi:restriction system protein